MQATTGIVWKGLVARARFEEAQLRTTDPAKAAAWLQQIEAGEMQYAAARAARKDE